MTTITTDTVGYATHLSAASMAAAQQDLVAKAIREFTHERLVQPVRSGTQWQLQTPGSTYTFTASEHPLEHLAIDPRSLRREIDGVEVQVDAQALVIELADILSIPENLMDVYLEEIASTLQAAAWVHHRGGPDSAALARADWQTVERSMTGHPGFVATNGRIGFGLDDYEAYAPEVGVPFSPFWVAVRRASSHLSLSAGLEEEEHYRRELGDDLDRFRATLAERGLDPQEYRFLPTHPWQWQHKIAITYAPEVGRDEIVPLGSNGVRYQAQQSIRTLANLDQPERSYVKMALSVQNMGFLRGLSAKYMEATPAINDFVYSLVEGDEDLKSRGFSVLREHAAIGWTGGVHTRRDPKSAFAKMTAALWRESPVPRLAEGERVITMASLLHRDADGGSLAAELIADSGVDPVTWVRGYLEAYVRPVLHCLLRHDLTFMPHGENLMLVIRDQQVQRVIMKDIGEEVAFLSDRPLPAQVERTRQIVDDAEREMCFFTDLVDGVLRHIGATLSSAGVLTDEVFWGQLAEVVAAHRADHPELHERFDFFRPEFRHTCLNRLQLRNTMQMVDITNQAESLISAGKIANPIATYAR